MKDIWFCINWLVLSIHFLPASGFDTQESGSLLVKTNVGAFQGKMSTETVRNWLGIPFGKSTNGTRRFRPPQRADILAEGTVYNATKYGPNCPELTGSSELITYNEDCLSLNIWAPTVSRLNSTGNATVLIWIYGGAFLLGRANDPQYDGNNWVRDQEDTIIVTINYRTNIFGFPTIGSGLRPSETNLGLLDQRLAVEWVYDNIRHFGGDPAKITLFGQSAGASSIAMWSYAYRFDPIARSFIMQSGTEFLTASISASNDTVARQDWNGVAARVGCAKNTSTETVSQFVCMQQVNVSTMLSAITSNILSTTPFRLPSFLPTPDDVSVFNRTQYLRMSQMGEFAKLPILFGSNENEGTSTTGFGIDDTSAATEELFTCPAGQMALDRYDAQVPTWQYRYQGLWPNINPPGTKLGTTHSSELTMVFHTYNMSTATFEQNQTSNLMQTAWTTFAKTPADGLSERYGWAMGNPYKNDLIVLGAQNSSQVRFASASNYTYGCAASYPRYHALRPNASDVALPAVRL